MTDEHQDRIRELVERIPTLTPGQLHWLNRVVAVFDAPHQYKIHASEILDSDTLENFGDALRIHHSFSAEPFSKDKFEYVLENVLKMSGHVANLAPKGNRGHDISIDGESVSLKTQADKNIKANRIWISKFMELGKGRWGDNPDDLVGLRNAFLEHLGNYERIYILRALEREPEWYYEFVEIPKNLLMSAEHGELEMKLDSRQFPKPGYCHVSNDEDVKIFSLYFDGGGERKLQIKNIRKDLCQVHASWKFTIPEH